VAEIHRSIKLVQVVGKGVAADCHRADHAQNAQAAAFELAKRDAERHHASRQALQVMAVNTVPPMNGEVASSTSCLTGFMWRICFTTA
jgi:hypothetical protein